MWHLADKLLTSRLLLGTAGYPSLEVMTDAVRASKTEVITVSLKRQMASGTGSDLFWQTIQSLNCCLLPNTAGCRDAQTAITTAEMARELFNTSWIKLEVIGDDLSLQPDPFELLRAANELVKRGFEVFPYCTDDLVLCQRLMDCGCRILMPWAAPIGSGKGLLNPFALETLRHRLTDVTLIVDAGIGKPSHATRILELGFDGVLLNSAVASAIHPVAMAEAFSHAVIAGRSAFEAGLMPERITAQSCTPLIDTPFWHQEVL
ncbi:thiazole synthase [Legionella cherrii]|uniref:Thiazole synthase n=1 Tax=Legionella cherrii TaxID=28084 RepID=A0A0W0S6Z7_9GAMM|nr:thiazole synthase [Legionella cherrii]KTC79056.1 thiamine biosynthesis protein ThiG [Legionella cherrii]VEB36459.1 thiamine biosynthesis protein ThiG [Legionella cherrii]